MDMTPHDPCLYPITARYQLHPTPNTRFSFFVYYGIGMGMIDFGPDGEVDGVRFRSTLTLTIIITIIS